MLRKKHQRYRKDKLSVEHNGLWPYLVRYLHWLDVKGYSANTGDVKDSRLRQFIQWCDERSLDDPRAITKPILERYQRHLFYYQQPNGQPLAYSTQKMALSALRSWFKWLTQENYLPSNPASEVLPIKQPQRLPERVLSVEDVHRILHSVNTDTLDGIRTRAIVEVLYSTGIRRLELCNLQVYDVDPRRKSLFVRQGKGGKDRSLPIGQRALDWVARYQEQVRPKLLLNLQENHLFLSDYGEAYTTSLLGHTVKKVMLDNGIERGSCHLFRHAMATHMLENGAELRYIQLMLGHANINTTTIYTHLSLTQLQHVHAITHPAEQPVT